MAVGVIFIAIGAALEVWALLGLGVPMVLAPIFFTGGFFTVETNKVALLSLCGKYVGTARRSGMHWNNCCFSKKVMDLGMSNFETPRIKVNDKDGLPIHIEAVIVWRFEDTAAAAYQLDNYNYFMHKQSEAALRELCT
jgi:regulator of protease activity HflC (stomatin/prohibitin superfamily)